MDLEIEGTICEEEELLPKPGTKSELWKYFGLKKDSNGKLVDDGTIYCKICRRKVLAKNGNTSNLKAHLKNNHKTVHSQLQQPAPARNPQVKNQQQQSIASSFAQSQPYCQRSKKQKDLNQAIAYFICKDGLPIYTVEREGFLSMAKSLDSRYVVPSRAHFSRSVIPDLYASTKQKVAQKLAGVKYFASTTDMWSSIGLTPYMSFTLHYIDEDWKLQSLALSASFLPDDHTADVLVDALEETLKEWSLDSKNLVCLTTDSGSNIVSAAKKLHWTRLSCFGHNLDLAITKALNKDKGCDRALALTRKVVSAFSCSWKRRRDLAKAQLNLDIPQHSLVSDCKTRWGSMQKMVERVLEQEKAIRVVLSADRKASHLLLTWQDLDVLTAINDTLSLLAEFTDVMSGEKYVTLSAVLPIINLLKMSVLKENTDDKPMTNELRSCIVNDLLKRNQDPDVICLLEMASFLDPRFKEKFVSDINYVKETLVSDAATLSLTDSSSSDHSQTLAPPAKKKRAIGSLLKSNDTEFSDLPTNISPEQKIKCEIDTYLSEQKLDVEENPLKWWNSHKSVYPFMAKISKKYLCAPATSTSSERIFSKGGRIVTPFRASLKPDTVEMLIFLSMNL